jgi:hypothetical protein
MFFMLFLGMGVHSSISKLLGPVLIAQQARPSDAF